MLVICFNRFTCHSQTVSYWVYLMAENAAGATTRLTFDEMNAQAQDAFMSYLENNQYMLVSFPPDTEDLVSD